MPIDWIYSQSGGLIGRLTGGLLTGGAAALLVRVTGCVLVGGGLLDGLLMRRGRHLRGTHKVAA